jgi:quinate/shikimate dehydrogenase
MLSPITGHTKLICLLGSPVRHSISPLMHNEAFRLLDLDYVYLCFDIGKEDLKPATDGLKSMGAVGFNLTMPNKTLMCNYVDELSPAAQLIGAINTVANKDGRFIGHNTDGIGYIRSLEAKGCNIQGKKMTLFGGGGAATAIAVQAALDGLKEIDVFSRKDSIPKCTKNIINKLNAHTKCTANIYDINDDTQLKKSLDESYILANATSVGMAPGTDACLIKDSNCLRSDLIVSDIIYNPRETKLLTLAKANGCKTYNGLYMLLYQGAEAFKIWTGEEMPLKKISEKYFN